MRARDRLVESAQELLWERGYVAMSPKAIQDRAGAGQGSMYHHFQSKADLAAVAIERSAAAFREGTEEWLSMSGTPLARIQAYMLRSRDALKGCRIGKLSQDPEIAGDVRLRQPIETTFEWLQWRLKGLIGESQKAGEILPGLDAAEVAAMLISVLQGGYVLAGASRSPESFDRAVRGALSLLKTASPTEGDIHDV
jgi:TetR/AcrR family transcriptional regulator, transcriptional repressor for nem operon